MVLRKPNDGQILARRNCAWATVGGDLNYLDAVANLGKDVPSGLRIIVATVVNEKAVTIDKSVPSNMLRILPVCLR